MREKIKDCDMIGKVFGYLRVVSCAEDGHKKLGGPIKRWNCVCRCGVSKPLSKGRICRGDTKSCGCAKAEFINAAAKKKNPDASLLNLMSIYKLTCAKRRGLAWELTKFQASLLFQSNCHYCGDAPTRVHVSGAGSPIKFNGIDRVDSAKGYEFDNCVPCCTTCNVMKMAMSKSAFFKKCAQIVLRHDLLAGGAAC